MAKVTAQTMTFHDHNRDGRPLKNTLWYLDNIDLREEEKKHPLIIMSHGSGSNRISLAWLAMPLAKKGCIVASPDHYGNTFDNPIPEQFKRYWERPRDLSFLLSQLLTHYGPSIDQDKIYAVGFSLGSYSVLALAGLQVDQNAIRSKENETLPPKVSAMMPEFGKLTRKVVDAKASEVPTDLKDERFKKIIALSPALGTGVDSFEQTKSIDVPVLLIAPGGDQIAPVKYNGRVYHHYLPQAQYIELPDDVGHFIFLPVNKHHSKKAAFWYEDAPGVDREKIHRETIQTVKKFLLS